MGARRTAFRSYDPGWGEGVGFGGRGACRRMSLSFVTVGGVYRLSMVRHFFGQTSTHALQVQQRSRSMFHSLSGFRTMMASVGQRFAQALQKMHASMSFSMCPRLRGVRWGSFSRDGYNRVAGRVKRFLMIVRDIPKTDIPTAPCS